jgi:hypothetical protein
MTPATALKDTVLTMADLAAKRYDSEAVGKALAAIKTTLQAWALHDSPVSLSFKEVLLARPLGLGTGAKVEVSLVGKGDTRDIEETLAALEDLLEGQVKFYLAAKRRTRPAFPDLF